MKIAIAPEFRNQLGLPSVKKRVLQRMVTAKADLRCRHISIWAEHRLKGKKELTVISTFPTSWISKYSIGGFSKLDPSIQKGLSSAGALIFDFEVMSRETSDQFAPQVLKADIGRYAVCVPVNKFVDLNVAVTFTFDVEPQSIGPTGTEPIMARLQQYAHSLVKIEFGELPEHSKTSDVLTKREQEVLRAVKSGKTYDEIAEILGISKWTVVAHIRSVKAKLGTVRLSDTLTEALARKYIH
ncbi:MAG: LuxR C-terminal-related transcriptional regulator [Pseudomonadota bacterium]